MRITRSGQLRDFINLMRNPGLGMGRFDNETLSDKDAKAIAEYVIKAFH